MRPDPVLVALFVVQRLTPIVALAAYVRGAGAVPVIAVAGGAWLVSMLQGARAVRIGATARRAAIEKTARAIVERSAPTIRGGGHDELLAFVWRGLAAHETLALELDPAIVAGVIATPLAFVVAAWIDGAAVAIAAVVAGALAVAVRVPLARRHDAAQRHVHEAYRVLGRDLGHGLRAVEDLQAHGLSDAFARRLLDEGAALAAAEARATRLGKNAVWLPLVVAGSVIAVTAGLAHDDLRTSSLLRLATVAMLGPLALQLARAIVRRSKERAAASALDAFAALPGARLHGGDRAPPASFVPITWESITFAYPPRLDLAKLAAPRADPSEPPRPIFTERTIRWEGDRPLAIVGANGSGKSTLLLLLLGLVEPSSGRVLVGDVDLARVDLAQFRARIAYVPQRPFVLEGMNVGEAMRLVATEATDETLRAALARVDLLDRLKSRGDPLTVPCGALSTGESQRIAVARALARSKAELIVFDEPEASLDPSARIELRKIIEGLANEGRRVVIATQHEEVVPQNAQRVEL